MRWYRRRWIWFVAAAAAVAALSPIIGRARPRTRPSEPIPPATPVLVPGSGACLALRQPMGPVPCPYEPPPAPVAGIDWGAPFERGRGRCEAAGQLAVTSGHVAATDPLVFTDRSPLATAVPDGRAPVVLVRSDDPATLDYVAFALLQLGPGRPVRWELALTPEGGDQYAVDAGTGCFVDGATLALMRAREERLADRAARIASAKVDPSDVEAWHAAASAADDGVPQPLDVMKAEGYREREYANVCVDPATGANLVVFRSGVGDGLYKTYVGRDAAGAVVALVTDFRVVDLGAGVHPWLAR